MNREAEARSPGAGRPLGRLVDLAHRADLYRGSLDEGLCELAEIASDMIDVDRVNVWVFEDGGRVLRCIEHYDRRSDTHAADMQLRADECPAYVEALSTELVVAVEDARADPRTAELEDGYLDAHGIGALLDAPIQRESETVGVVCHEHVDGARSWTGEERHRARLVADFVALALESRRRRALEEKYRNLFNLSQDMIFLLDGETGQFRETNRRAAETLGYPEQELVGMEFRDIHPPEALEGGEAAFHQVVETGKVRFLSQFITRDEEIIPVEIAAHRLEVGGEAMVQAVARDVSDWIEAQEALQSSERRYRELFERNVAGVFRTTPDGQILDANRAFARMLGFDSADELLRMDRDEVKGLFAEGADRKRLLERLRSAGSVENFEVRLRRKDGSTVWALENSSLETDPETGLEVIEGTLVNVTERKRLQEELERMAYHDVLTDLANRRLLRARAEKTLARARRSGGQAALVYLDLERFKRVNDTLGHGAGDQVLVETGRRLQDAVRDSDTVARVGGDEFAVLLAETEGEEGARQAADRLADALSGGIYVQGETVHLDARIGIALFPDHAEDFDTLLTAADAALYQSAEPALEHVHIFTPGRGDAPSDELLLEREIRRAIEEDALLLYYQPIIRGEDDSVEGAEALVRWEHEDRGLLASREFIHLAERTALVQQLDWWTIETVLERLAAWKEVGGGPDWVSVNLSATTLRDPEMADRLRQVLSSRGVDPERLVLEVTERIAVRDPEQVRGRLEEIREMGVGVALDDFGTGHSALAYLHQLPADLLKMDGIFIRGLHRDPVSRGNVANAILQLGRAVGARVAAENVETEFQRRWLGDAGFDLLQGYVLGEPVPPDDLESRLL